MHIIIPSYSAQTRSGVGFKYTAKESTVINGGETILWSNQNKG